MPISFVFRNLTGLYRGGTANAINDYIKISNMFQEVAKDLTSIDGRLKALEAKQAQIITNNNFTTNSISGTVIQNNTLPGSAIQNNSITGAQIITNSIDGLTDANLASNANINPAKIDLANLSHTQIKDIGVNTHPQIDTFITNTSADITGIDTSISIINATIGSLNTSLFTLNAFVDPGPMSTTAQNVVPAINELYADFQSVGSSGTFISGPGSPTLNSVARWGADNRHLKDSMVVVDDAGNTNIAGSVTFTTDGSLIATSGVPVNTTFSSYIVTDNIRTINQTGPLTILGDVIPASGSTYSIGTHGGVVTTYASGYYDAVYTHLVSTTDASDFTNLKVYSNNGITLSTNGAVGSTVVQVDAPAGFLRLKGTPFAISDTNVNTNIINMYSDNMNNPSIGYIASNMELQLTPASGLVLATDTVPDASGTRSLGFYGSESIPFAQVNTQKLFIDPTPALPTIGQNLIPSGTSLNVIAANCTAANSLVFITPTFVSPGAKTIYPTMADGHFVALCSAGFADVDMTFNWMIVN